MHDPEDSLRDNLGYQLLQAEKKMRDSQPVNIRMDYGTDEDYELIVAFLENELPARQMRKVRTRLRHEEGLRALLGLYCESVRDTPYGEQLFSRQSSGARFHAWARRFTEILDPGANGPALQWGLASAALAIAAIASYSLLYNKGGNLPPTQLASNPVIEAAFDEAAQSARASGPSVAHAGSVFIHPDMAQLSAAAPVSDPVWEGVANRAAQSVVYLRTRNGTLSGFFEDASKSIITVGDAARNATLDGLGRLFVDTTLHPEQGTNSAEGTGTTDRAYLYWSDQRSGISVFRMEGFSLSQRGGVPLVPDSADLDDGTPLCVVAPDPEGNLWQARTGTVTQTPRPYAELVAQISEYTDSRPLASTTSLLMTSISAAPGMPGAPLLTATGEAVGMCALAAPPTDTLGPVYWYLSADEVRRTLLETPNAPASRSTLEPEEWLRHARPATTSIKDSDGQGNLFLGRGPEGNLVYLALDQRSGPSRWENRRQDSTTYPDGFQPDFLWVLAADESFAYALYNTDGKDGLDEIRVDTDGDGLVDFRREQQVLAYTASIPGMSLIDPEFAPAAAAAYSAAVGGV